MSRAAFFSAALLSAALVGLAALPSSAGVMFFENNQAGFNTAVADYTYLGTEDFEESTLSDGASVSFAGPLSQTSTTPPYDDGIELPIVVSVNGAGDLAAFKNDQTVVSTVVLANTGSATLDWNFQTSDHIVAVGLNPVTFSGSGVTHLSTIRVYDTSDQLLDMRTMDSDDAGSTYLGILATGSSRIGRINFQGLSSTGSNRSEGGDNAALYSWPVPEPSTWLLAAIGLAALGSSAHRQARGKN
jgi:hypothetical protein